jgi:hypothetical protein
MAMDGGQASPAGSRRTRVLLAVAVAIVLVLAVGVGVVLGTGGGKGGKGGATATGIGGGAAGTGGIAPTGGAGQGATGTDGGGGQASSGGGGTGGASSPTTIPATTTTTSPATTTTSPATATTVPHLRITGLASSNVTAACTLSPAGYYTYTVHVEVRIQTRGTGILVFQWGRGAADVKSPPIEYDIPPERDGISIFPQDVISGRAPSANAIVVDRLHMLNPPGVDVLTITHSVC